MNTVVLARISEEVKNEAAAILEAMGLTVSDAFRIMMTRIAREHALPLEPLVPNEETIAAMRAVRQGKTETVTIDQLQTVLDADDPPSVRIDVTSPSEILCEDGASLLSRDLARAGGQRLADEGRH